MTLIKYRPTVRGRNVPVLNSMFDDIFGRDISEFCGTDSLNTSPAVNVTENESTFRIEVAAPGYKKDDFTISVDNGTIVISSEVAQDEGTPDVRFTRREFNYRGFRRSFTLPDSVDSDAIKAKYSNGVLEVSIPKVAPKEKETLRKIKIS